MRTAIWHNHANYSEYCKFTSLSLLAEGASLINEGDKQAVRDNILDCIVRHALSTHRTTLNLLSIVRHALSTHRTTLNLMST